MVIALLAAVIPVMLLVAKLVSRIQDDRLRLVIAIGALVGCVGQDL